MKKHVQSKDFRSIKPNFDKISQLDLVHVVDYELIVADSTCWIRNNLSVWHNDFSVKKEIFSWVRLLGRNSFGAIEPRRKLCCIGIVISKVSSLA